VWKQCYDKILLGQFVKDWKFPERKKRWVPTSSGHLSTTHSTTPQNALSRIVVQKQNFPRKSNLLYPTGLLTNSTEDHPSSTGLLVGLWKVHLSGSVNCWFLLKNGEIALWPSTNGAIAYFLKLPGSLLSITEITEYKYLIPLKPWRRLKYKSEQNIVPLDFIIEPIMFLWNIIYKFY